MRKILVIGVSILSVFILCSLSYQPITADTPIVTITQLKKSKAYNLDVEETKELYYMLVNYKSQSNCDCSSHHNKITPTNPLFCFLLILASPIILTLYFLYTVLNSLGLVALSEVFYYGSMYIAFALGMLCFGPPW